LPAIAEYLQGETTFEMGVDNPGTYMLTFDLPPEASAVNPASFYFAVSDLAVFSRSSAKDRYDFLL